MDRTFFDNRYVYVKTLGHGGMGNVYLARNVQLGSLWAIKEVVKNAVAGADFLAEPNILKKLSHPALPRIVDIDEDEQYLYIVEDFIEGYSLDVQLDMLGRFPESQVVDWAKQLCDVLAYLHNRKPNPIIYRDMKPANLIVDSNNHVKLIDFGIAREFKDASTQDTSYVGTRGYAAPEQYGVGQTDERTDIYGLGVTLYHLLTGKSPNEPPYHLLPLRELDPKLSEGIAHIVAKCTRPNPSSRYQNISQLAYDLKNIKRFNSDYKRTRFISFIKLLVRGVIVAGSVFSIVLGLNMIRADRESTYKNYLQNGYDLIDQLRFDEAQTFFEAAARQNKKDTAAELGISDILVKKGEYETCINFLKECAPKISGDEETAHFNRNMGYSYMELKDTQNAVFYLERAVKLAPDKTDWLTDLAICYANQKNYKEAQAIIEKINASGGGSFSSQFIEGQILFVEGKLEAARTVLYKVALQSEDTSLQARAYTTIANSYGMSGDDLPQKIRVLEEALDKLPNTANIQIIEMLGEAYYNSGQGDDAAAMFQMLLDKGYNRAYIYRNLAIIYQEQNKLQLADKALKKMLELFPTDYTCYIQLVYLHLELENEKPQQNRNYSEALNYYNLAVQYSPQGESAPELQPLKNMLAELR